MMSDSIDSGSSVLVALVGLGLLSWMSACSGGTSSSVDAGVFDAGHIVIHDSGYDATIPETCGFQFGTYCAACVTTSCCSQWQACGDSSACVTLRSCLLACGSNGSAACLQACSNASSMPTVDLYNAADDCLSTKCNAACYGSGTGGSALDAGGKGRG